MKRLFPAPVLSLLFAAPVAMAQSAHDHGQTTDHDKAGHAASTASKPDEFAQLDANKDGTLSKAELARHRLGPHFGMLDGNRDGKLSPAEFAAGKGM